METTQMSINRQKDKGTMLYLSNGILLSNENNKQWIHTIVTLEIITLEINAVFTVCQLWLNNSVKKQSGEIIFILNILMKKLMFRGYVAYCHIGENI